MSVIPKTKDQVDQWRSVMFLYDSALKKLNTKIEILNNEFVNRYDHNPIEHIKSRLKTADSIVKKLKKDGYEVTIENMMDHLSDIAGIRIICSFTSDIYQIADMIAAQGDITVLHVKDYIQNPKPNGYKSYHMVVTVPVYLADGPVQTKVEIQIRSVAMDFWASLEHKIAYKFEGNAPEDVVNQRGERLARADPPGEFLRSDEGDDRQDHADDERNAHPGDAEDREPQGGARQRVGDWLG